MTDKPDDRVEPWIEEWRGCYARSLKPAPAWADEIATLIEQVRLDERRKVGREITRRLPDITVDEIRNQDIVRRICKLEEEA